jgi:hypothetical protein
MICHPVIPSNFRQKTLQMPEEDITRDEFGNPAILDGQLTGCELENHHL